MIAPGNHIKHDSRPSFGCVDEKNLAFSVFLIVVEYHFSEILVEYCKFYFELINTFQKCMQMCVYMMPFFLRCAVLKRIKNNMFRIFIDQEDKFNLDKGILTPSISARLFLRCISVQLVLGLKP